MAFFRAFDERLTAAFCWYMLSSVSGDSLGLFDEVSAAPRLAVKLALIVRFRLELKRQICWEPNGAAKPIFTLPPLALSKGGMRINFDQCPAFEDLPLT